jgi:sortase A
MKLLIKWRRRSPLWRATLRWSEYFLLAVGFLCLGYVGFSKTQAYLYQSYESYQLERSLQGKGATVSDFVQSFFKPTEPPPPIGIKADAPDLTQDPGLIGRVEIPRLDISATVREGVDAKTLSHAVGHVPSTPLPGSPGNVAIAAHRDTYFRNVRNIRKGDTIRMVTRKGTYEYAVESLKIVEPTEVKVLDPTPEPVITLVTCYPFNYVGSAPNRFIVRARQLGVEARVSPPVRGLERSVSTTAVSSKQSKTSARQVRKVNHTAKPSQGVAKSKRQSTRYAQRKTPEASLEEPERRKTPGTQIAAFFSRIFAPVRSR